MSGLKVEKSNEVSQKSKGISSLLTKKGLGLPAKKVTIVPESCAIYVRRLLQNWRQGTVGCKDRSMVSFSNKKPWKQKGTGRARAGSLKSPLWRKGGVVFGPQKRVKKLKVTARLRKDVLAGVLDDFLVNKRIITLDWELKGNSPKTKQAFEILKNAKLWDKKINLFLPIEDVKTAVSFANIPNVQILYFDQANAYDLLNSDVWVVLSKDVENFKEMVSKWI